MLAGFHLREANRGLKLGFVDLNKGQLRDCASDLQQNSKIFKNTNEDSWKAGIQARTNQSYMTILAYENEATVEVKTLTKFDLAERGLMKKSYDVTESHIVGVFEHPCLKNLHGRFVKLPFFLRWLKAPRYVFWGKSADGGKNVVGAKPIGPTIQSLRQFLDIVPVTGIELSGGKFYFVHRKLEQDIDFPALTKAFKDLGESFDRL